MENPGRVHRDVDAASDTGRLADRGIQEACEVRCGRAGDLQTSRGLALGQAGVHPSRGCDLLQMEVALQTREGGGGFGEAAARFAGLTGQGRQECQAQEPVRLRTLRPEPRMGPQLGLGGPPSLRSLAGLDRRKYRQRASSLLQRRGPLTMRDVETLGRVAMRPPVFAQA